MQSHVCVLAASLTPVGLPSDLVIKGVMDDAWLADANSAFDRFATQPERIRLVPEAVLRENGHVWPEGSSPLLKGKPAPGPGQKEGEGAIHRPRMGGVSASRSLRVFFPKPQSSGCTAVHSARRAQRALQEDDRPPQSGSAPEHDAWAWVPRGLRADGLLLHSRYIPMYILLLPMYIPM